MTDIRSYKDLRVWQVGMELAARRPTPKTQSPTPQQADSLGRQLNVLASKLSAN
jgi:hypothetical protein